MYGESMEFFFTAAKSRPGNRAPGLKQRVDSHLKRQQTNRQGTYLDMRTCLVSIHCASAFSLIAAAAASRNIAATSAPLHPSVEAASEETSKFSASCISLATAERIEARCASVGGGTATWKMGERILSE